MATETTATKKQDIEFNKNEDHMKLLISKMERKLSDIYLGGGKKKIEKHHAKGKLKQGVPYVHESYIGSTFIGRIEEETTLNNKPAILPSIQGWAKTYGYNTIIINDDDPYAHGFQVI